MIRLISSFGMFFHESSFVIEEIYSLNYRNDTFVVTVDNVTGLIKMPNKPDYNIEEFRALLEKRINSLADNFGRTVNGVTLEVKT